ANGAISGAWVNLFNDQFGFGREAMKNPLRMLWEGFRMRFGGFESDMAEVAGLHGHLESVSRQAQNGATGVMEAMEGLSLEAGLCAGAGSAVCVSGSVSQFGITRYVGYGKGYGLRPYAGLSYSPVQHQGIVSFSFLGSSNVHAQFIVSQAGISVGGFVGASLTPFAGSTVGYARTTDWHTLLRRGPQ
ncbi:MAG TPA: hypothetical protein VMQ83_08310, partial [Gammaproteobacteria bacterium]|nr:hypothetical protein [Gammaproteobacteria bacterium]